MIDFIKWVQNDAPDWVWFTYTILVTILGVVAFFTWIYWVVVSESLAVFLAPFVFLFIALYAVYLKDTGHE